MANIVIKPIMGIRETLQTFKVGESLLVPAELTNCATWRARCNQLIKQGHLEGKFSMYKKSICGKNMALIIRNE